MSMGKGGRSVWGRVCVIVGVRVVGAVDSHVTYLWSFVNVLRSSTCSEYRNGTWYGTAEWY